MKSITRIILCGFALAVLLERANAQTSTNTIVGVVADEEGLPLVLPDDLPSSGTFWVTDIGNGGTVTVPWPCMPPSSDAPVYSLPNGVFLVDQTTNDASTMTPAAITNDATPILDLIDMEQEEAAAAASGMTRGLGFHANDLPALPDPGTNYDDETNDDSGYSYYTLPDYGTNLWIAQWAMTNGTVTGIASNTLEDAEYEIQTNTDLTTTNWGDTGFFIFGSETTNWTALIPMPVNLTNNLFFRLKSWADTTGTSIPDWWWLYFFGQDTNVNVYADPAGDGWSNYQKFERGWIPTNFYTPSTPQGLAVDFNTENGNVSLAWQPSPGPVTSYTIERQGYTTTNFTVSANSTVYQDGTTLADFPNYAGDYGYGPTYYGTYQIQANYSGTNSAWSSPVDIESGATLSAENAIPPIPASFVPGSQGTVYLAAGQMPSGTTQVELTHYIFDGSGDVVEQTNYFIPSTSFTNGLYAMPPTWVTSVNVPTDGDYSWYAQGWGSVTNTTSAVMLYDLPVDGGGTWTQIEPTFLDGREQLKQNLIFQLRAATVNAPFQFIEQSSYGEDGDGQITSPANYVYSGFYQLYNSQGYVDDAYGAFDAFLPFYNNYHYRNFVMDFSEMDPTNGFINTGVNGAEYGSSYYLYLDSTPTYALQQPLPIPASTNFDSLLTTNQTDWLYTYPSDIQSGVDLSAVGLYVTNFPLHCTMLAGVKNYWGLPFVSTELAYNDGSFETNTLYPGDTFNANGNTLSASFYTDAAQPLFQTQEYDFWNANDVPGTANFSPTNQSDVLIVGVGNSIQVNGYAKLAVTNGYSGVYAYLAQYFTNAYQIDTNGDMTTNQTGLISPYGNFFATQPGPVALVTMPDIDTAQQGTGVVNCVSLNVDKNHDGVMDLSWNGSDVTSPANPMRIWVNNGHIVPGGNGVLDQDIMINPEVPPNYAAGQITCVRDLENFFRLWVCGVPSLALADNYTFTLSFQNTTGNPAINVYSSCETNGGIGYLTDTNVAAQQSNAGTYGFGLMLGTVSNNVTCTIPSIAFAFGGTQHFLFEGAGIGSGQLTLTIMQNSNFVAATSVWLDLHDITDFYEVALATNVPTGLPPSSLVSQFQMYNTIAAPPDETPQYTVFVHGINNTDFDVRDDTETIFKRLYWSGYHGRVAAFRWPCAYLPNNLANPLEYLKAFNFDKGEFYAWKSASAFKDYLTYLQNRPDLTNYSINILAHSQGNIVASEALEQGAPFDNYILTQAAVPAQCYDTTIPFLQKFLDAETNAPTPLYATNGGYHGYFANLTGNLVNFYNTNDFALISGFVGPFAVSWEADQISQKPESYQYLNAQSYYYSTSGNISYAAYPGGSYYYVTDLQEAKAMVARSRTHAVGAQGAVGGVMNTNSSIDLFATFKFGNTRDDHSAQFKWPIQAVWEYYDAVLSSFGINAITR